LWENENERQKTEQVPIPLPRAAGSCFEAKKMRKKGHKVIFRLNLKILHLADLI
jgi:hypothetical protein